MHPLAIYYDLQIAILLVASGAVCFLLHRDRLKTPRSWAARSPRIAKTVATLAGCAFALVFYGSFIEPRIITVTRADVTLTDEHRLTAPVRIAVLSDFHVGPYKRERFVRRVVSDVLKLHPDVVLLAGDFVYTDDGTAEWIHLAPLRELAAAVPTLAVFGNHDTGLGDEYRYIERPGDVEAIKQVLRDAGIKTLENEHAILEAGGVRIAVAGLTELRTGRTNPLRALQGIPAEVPRIVLAHNPGVISFLDPRTTDLVVTGHTHGGQIRLPLLPPLVRLPTPLGQRYDNGLFRFNSIPLFIARGIGESGPRARLFAPPEIAVLTIR